jgi:hypothetical protein
VTPTILNPPPLDFPAIFRLFILSGRALRPVQWGE